MRKNNKVSKVAYMSSYPPRKCGIAEFTADTANANQMNAMFLPIDKDGQKYLWPIGEEYVINQMDSSSYVNAVGLVVQENAIEKAMGNGEVVLDAEHEFGLDGNGKDNNYNAAGRVARDGGVSSVARLHTVIDPTLYFLHDFQRDIIKEMGKVYGRLAVMTPSAKKVLTSSPYDIDPDKIVCIPHGIVEQGRGLSKESKKRRFGLEGRVSIGTAGMVSEGKGLDFNILGFSQFLKSVPPSERAKYNLILYGGTHPEVLAHKGGEDPYREKLWKMAADEGLNPIEVKNENINAKRKLDLDKHKVVFVNTHISSNVLEEFIQAMDVGMTLYKNPTQGSSGIGAKLAGYGIPCVSTDFMFHNDLFRDENGEIDNSGYLVKYKCNFPVRNNNDVEVDPDEVAKGLRHVLEHHDEMTAKILLKGVQMGWSVVGAQNRHMYNQLVLS